MKIKVIKRAPCPRGTIFKVSDPRLISDYRGVCDELEKGAFKMRATGCSFKPGIKIEMPISEIAKYGKAQFAKFFEILEGGPKEEATPETPLVIAMTKLMDEGKVAKKTGMPSCPDLSEILGRNVSKSERDAAFEAAFEEIED